MLVHFCVGLSWLVVYNVAILRQVVINLAKVRFLQFCNYINLWNSLIFFGLGFLVFLKNSAKKRSFS